MSALVEAYESKEEFYRNYGRLGRGWGNLDHTRAPGGLDTALSRVRREGCRSLDLETWAIMVACPRNHSLLSSYTFGEEEPVPGAVVATSSQTGQVRVLLSSQNIQSAFDVILEMERGNRHPDDFTFEEVTAAVVAPYRGYDSISSMKFSAHFEKDRQNALDRREITLEMCEQVKADPLEWDRDDQPKDRTAYWGYVAEKGRYLKVVVEADGEEITTAHWDRAFRRRMERLEGDEK